MKFYVGIRQLQCILLKVALILGVEFHEGVGFEALVPPPEDQTESKSLSTLGETSCLLSLIL